MRIITGTLKGRKLCSPSGSQTRPITDMIKGALFNVLGDRIVGCRFLDLFAGSGSVGLEAVSRGASEVVWVECSGLALRALRQNVLMFCPDRMRALIRSTVVRFLGRPGSYDIVFADPPFPDDPSEFVHLVASVLAPEGLFILRHQRKTVFAQPKGLVPAFSRRYGDSVLAGFQRSPPSSIG